MSIRFDRSICCLAIVWRYQMQIVVTQNNQAFQRGAGKFLVKRIKVGLFILDDLQRRFAIKMIGQSKNPKEHIAVL